MYAVGQMCDLKNAKSVIFIAPCIGNFSMLFLILHKLFLNNVKEMLRTEEKTTTCLLNNVKLHEMRGR